MYTRSIFSSPFRSFKFPPRYIRLNYSLSSRPPFSFNGKQPPRETDPPTGPTVTPRQTASNRAKLFAKHRQTSSNTDPVSLPANRFLVLNLDERLRSFNFIREFPRCSLSMRNTFQPNESRRTFVFRIRGKKKKRYMYISPRERQLQRSILVTVGLRAADEQRFNDFCIEMHLKF